MGKVESGEWRVESGESKVESLEGASYVELWPFNVEEKKRILPFATAMQVPRGAIGGSR